MEFGGKQLWDPIRYGTSFNLKVDEEFFWRDYLKVWVHPNFNAPHKPPGFRYVKLCYCMVIMEAQTLSKWELSIVHLLGNMH